MNKCRFEHNDNGLICSDKGSLMASYDRTKTPTNNKYPLNNK